MIVYYGESVTVFPGEHFLSSNCAWIAWGERTLSIKEVNGVLVLKNMGVEPIRLSVNQAGEFIIEVS